MKDFSPLGLLSLFEDEKRRANVRESTINWYRYACEKFIDHAAVGDVRQFTPDHARTWIDGMRRRGLKPGAIRSYQSACWAWLAWLSDDTRGKPIVKARIHKIVPFVKVRIEEQTRRTASEDVRDKLITCALARGEWPYRNAALVEVLWSTGLRRDELAHCRYSDLDMEAGELTVRHTKTGNPRVVGVGKDARYALNRYFVEERGRAPGPLFIAREKRPMSNNAIGQVLKSLATSANVAVSAHDFRRSLAARMLTAKLPIDVVQSQLGHDSPSMSLLYGSLGRPERSLAMYHEFDAGIRAIREEQPRPRRRRTS